MLDFDTAAASPAYAYHRFESWRSNGIVKDDADVVCFIYHHNPKSPSGRQLAAISHNGDEALAALKKHKRV